jgi:hypothetical protein
LDLAVLQAQAIKQLRDRSFELLQGVSQIASRQFLHPDLKQERRWCIAPGSWRECRGCYLSRFFFEHRIAHLLAELGLGLSDLA